MWKYLKNISDDSLVFQHSFSESEVTIYIKCQGHFEICEVSKCWNMAENCNNICMGLDNRKIILMFSLSGRIPSLEFPSIQQKHKFFYRPPDTFGPLSRLCRFQMSLYLHVMYLSPTSQHLLNSHNIYPSQLMPHPTPFFTEKKKSFHYIYMIYLHLQPPFPCLPHQNWLCFCLDPLGCYLAKNATPLSYISSIRICHPQIRLFGILFWAEVT